MPEGDTIAKLRSYLGPRLEGRQLQGGALRDRPGLALKGRTVESVDAHGKHLFLRFEDGDVLRSHLGMYGTWHRYPHGRDWKRPREHASVWLATQAEVFVCFYAMEVELGDASLVATRQRRRLGADLIHEELPQGEDLAKRVRELLAPDAPLVDLLLDQRIAAGIGNVYKSETLFLEGLAPWQPLRTLSVDRLERLFSRASSLLARNLRGGPRITRGLPAGHGDRSGRVWVYGRHGRPCLRCGSPIQFRRMGRGHRSTYWCPVCNGNRSSRPTSAGPPNSFGGPA